MKPKIILFFLMIFLAVPVFAQNQNSNVLLPKKFISFQTYVPVYDTEKNELVKQIGGKHINEIVFDKVLNGKVKAYGINNFDEYFPYDYKVIDTLTLDEIIAIISANKVNDKQDFKEVKYYNFIEEWIYDADAFAFEKKVIAYQPVREYRPEEDDIYRINRKIVFTILNPEKINTAGTIPIMKVKPEFYFEIPDNLQKYTNVDGINVLSGNGIYLESKLTPYWNSSVRSKIVNSIFDKVLENTIPVFDMQNGHYVPVSEVKNLMGITKDTIRFENIETGQLEDTILLRSFDPFEIKSMYFIENWFINPENLNFRKEIDGVIPVRFYLKEPDDSIYTKLPIGPIYFDNENKDRLELIYKQLTNNGSLQDCLDGVELFTNMFKQSKNQIFKTQVKEKQQMLLNYMNKQNQGNIQNLKMIQESKQTKL